MSKARQIFLMLSPLKAPCSGSQAAGLLTGQTKLRRAVGGHGNFKNSLTPFPGPAALHPAIDALVTGFGISEMSAGPGADGEVIFPVYPDAAHGLKQPFTDRALGVVVQGRNAVLRQGTLKGFPDGGGAVLRHKKTPGPFV